MSKAREEIIEATARALCQARYGHMRGYDTYRVIYATEAIGVLEAICNSIPCLSDVISGKAVIVPVECTDEIAEAIAARARCCGGIAADIYTAMIEARAK